jgi:hypothetical protein
VPGADIGRVKDEFVREWKNQVDWKLRDAVTNALAWIDPINLGGGYVRHRRRQYRWPKGRPSVFVRIRIPDLAPPPFAGSRPRVVFGRDLPTFEAPGFSRGRFTAQVESATWGRRSPSVCVRVQRS